VRPDFCHSGGCLPSGCAKCNRWHAGPFKLIMAPTKFLAVLPFLGILLGPVFLNRVTPFVLGMPLLLAWLLLWIMLTSGIMALIYLTDPANRRPEPEA
jgi:Protein of unknown function (DUF3311)